MAHTPKYKNGTVLQNVTSAWAHLFQARQFQGKGDPRFDVSLIMNAEQKAILQAAAEQLAIEAFPAGEYNTNPQFAWPYTQTELKTSSPKLGELFPGHWIISAKAYEDNPPQVMIPDANNPGAYVPMPEGMRSQLVFDGALCYAGIDMASYVSGQNIGIRVQINFIVYYGAGTPVAIGARPDANTGMAGINVQMQAPQGMANLGTPPNTGMPVQQGVQPQVVQPAVQPAVQPQVVQPAVQPIGTAAPVQQGVAPVDFT